MGLCLRLTLSLSGAWTARGRGRLFTVSAGGRCYWGRSHVAWGDGRHDGSADGTGVLIQGRDHGCQREMYGTEEKEKNVTLKSWTINKYSL